MVSLRNARIIFKLGWSFINGYWASVLCSLQYLVFHFLDKSYSISKMKNVMICTFSQKKYNIL